MDKASSLEASARSRVQKVIDCYIDVETECVTVGKFLIVETETGMDIGIFELHYSVRRPDNQEWLPSEPVYRFLLRFASNRRECEQLVEWMRSEAKATEKYRSAETSANFLKNWNTVLDQRVGD